MSWNSITNPISGEKYSIFSSNGRELLKQYLRLVKTHQSGGDYRLDLGAEPVGGLPPVAGYDGCEEAAGAQSGGDYRLDLGAEPVRGLPPVAGYDGCEEAAGTQVGGDYFLDPAAETVGGQAVVVGYRQVPHNPPHPTPQ
tara:strand:- start:127 stop:546 length:420 start_codon:yes stop_codon:yes gene_type:complete